MTVKVKSVSPHLAKFVQIWTSQTKPGIQLQCPIINQILIIFHCTHVVIDINTETYHNHDAVSPEFSKD